MSLFISAEKCNLSVLDKKVETTFFVLDKKGIDKKLS